MSFDNKILPPSIRKKIEEALLDAGVDPATSCNTDFHAPAPTPSGKWANEEILAVLPDGLGRITRFPGSSTIYVSLSPEKRAEIWAQV